jgi:ssDNA thymidine ADP-ribosyltransferase, DarT
MTEIERLARKRGITRLSHLTPFQNLIHIARGEGLRSTLELSADARAAFTQQDLERLDGHPDHISCSIEYPNVWYLRQRRKRATPLQKLFPDWVCVLIEPHHLWRDDTLVCFRNAAAAHGAYVDSGPAAFEAMYTDSVVGSGGRTYTRGAKPDSCPTDDQAEVLVAKQIPLADANRVVIADTAGASRVLVGLDLLNVPPETFEIIIAPKLFQISLSTELKAGRLPTEILWTYGDGDAT